MAGDSYQFSTASPIASSGLDIDKLLAQDPEAIEQARAMGLPFNAPQKPAAVRNAGMNPPQPAGTSANQQPPYFLRNNDASTPVPAKPAMTDPEHFLRADGQPENESLMSGFGSRLAQGEAAATNAPNPSGDKTAPPAVPSTVTPTGSAQGPTDMDRAQSGLARVSQMGEDYTNKLASQPTMAQTIQPIEEQRKTLAQPMDPNAPEYRPSAGQRIARGIAAYAKGGIQGALQPESESMQPYNAPNRKFTLEAQKRAGQIASLDQQEKLAQDTYKDDTGRAKDVITSINDIGKNYAAGITGAYHEDIAKIRGQEADTKDQLADIKQQVAAYQQQAKIPSTYEATVAASHLESDPKRAASLEAAAKEMAATEKRKFELAARAAGGPLSTWRQSAIDAATSEIDALQHKYTYDPRRNQYVNPNQPNDVLSPNEYTDKKNEISTKLDKTLTSRKQPALGVRFNPSDAGADKPSGRAARQQASSSANAGKGSEAKSAAEAQPGQTWKGYQYIGPANGKRTDKANWKPVKQ